MRVVVDIPGLLEMVELPGGTFRMGSPQDDEQAYSDEQPQHLVTVSGFAMSRCTVTRQLYRAVMGAGPRQWEREAGDAQLPANYLNWLDAVEFCNQLSIRQGYTPCYRRTGDTVHWDQEADGYRLPTEAEWEYAARAGTTTRWVCGDEPSDLAAYAWFGEGLDGQPHPVGTKRANPWGLYDMAGNVWEWCWDWYGAYVAAVTPDPVGPPTGAWRVLRGGAFWRVARFVRSARRNRVEPEHRNVVFGVRIVRRPRRQP